jgi:CBS domain-containing protein
MVSETGDVQSFLAKHPPFNHLSQNQLEFASANIFVAFSKSGSELSLNDPSPGAHVVGILVVRSGSLEIRTEQGVLLDRLSVGDYLIPSVLYAGSSKPRVIVLEDCLYYELTDYALQSLKNASSEIAALCDLDARRARLKSDDSSSVDAERFAEQRVQQLTRETYLNQYVKDTMSDKVVCADPKTTIRAAAQLMKQHHISSLLIKDDKQLLGIITDRDFRTRVLAEGITGDVAIEQVMTSAPMCVDVNSRLHDAQLKMMSEGIHHLPVLAGQEPVGIITLSDILRTNNVEPLSLIRAINYAQTVTELKAAADEIPDMVVKLVERDARAVEVGQIITSLTDSMSKRLLKLAEQQYGPPPCAYAWLAFGSQARQEQVLGSDQDNGLLLPDDIAVDETEYFKDFAAFVNDGLDKCGMPFCPGDIMAKNEKWRMSLQGWKSCFASWIEEPSPKALMHASIFFDMRHIAGKIELTEALQRYVLERAQSNTIFLALMCENALLHSPPLGFFKTFVLESDGDHNHTLELKKRGTIPVVDIARNYALSVGVQALNTIERLQAIEQSGAMSKEMAYSLIDAHEFIAGIRLAAQAREYRAQRTVDNYLDPQELSPLVRHQLKDAFHLVREAQHAMKVRFSGGIL